MTVRSSHRRATTAGLVIGIAAIAAAGVAVATMSDPVAEGASPRLTAATAAPGTAPGAEESVTPSPTALASSPSTAPGRPSTSAPAEPAEQDEPSPRPSPEAPSLTPGVLPDPFTPIETLDPVSAELLLGAALTAPDSAGATEVVELERAFADIAADAFQEEIESEWLELTSSGWTITGERRVDDLEITDLGDDTATIVACIDSSDVTLVDAAGDPVGSESAGPARAQHVFTLAKDDGAWRVTDRTFPDDPTC
ncbi:MAG: hypothetical protein ACTMIH_08630 [Microbacterium gubbeenense]|uniref:hypothetical protein n=1 Tax=Microbacterium gubbeenense TaxID=159896 RepID=UPI003F991A77